MKAYKAEGFKGLKDKTIGVKSEDKKLLTAREAVKELLERKFGIILAFSTMGDYLRSWRYSLQKQKNRAYEQCSKKFTCG